MIVPSMLRRSWLTIRSTSSRFASTSSDSARSIERSLIGALAFGGEEGRVFGARILQRDVGLVALGAQRAIFERALLLEHAGLLRRGAGVVQGAIGLGPRLGQHLVRARARPVIAASAMVSQSDKLLNHPIDIAAFGTQALDSSVREETSGGRWLRWTRSGTY